MRVTEMDNCAKLDYICHRDRETLEKVQRFFGEDDEKRRQFIEEVRIWLKEQANLSPRTDDHVLTIYARGCKYDMEKAKQKLVNNLVFKAAFPQIFSDWDPFKPEIQAALSAGPFLPLPGYDDQKRKVFIVRHGNYDPYVINKADVEKVGCMVGDLSGIMHEEYCVHNVVLLYDWSGLSFSHFRGDYFWATKTITRYFQEAYPLHPKLIVCLHTSRIFTYILGATKMILKEKIKKRIHDVGSDFELLHQLIPKAILPKDYGGDGISLDQLTADWKKKIEDNRQWVMEQTKYKAIESNESAETRSRWFGLF